MSQCPSCETIVGFHGGFPIRQVGVWRVSGVLGRVGGSSAPLLWLQTHIQRLDVGPKIPLTSSTHATQLEAVYSCYF